MATLALMRQARLEGKMVYINRKGQGYTETVDQFETRKEAKEMLLEYRTADPSALYYMSQRCCKDWAIANL
jgi:hypothetical protein